MASSKNDNHLPATSHAKISQKLNYTENVEFYSVWAPIPIDLSSNGPV